MFDRVCRFALFAPIFFILCLLLASCDLDTEKLTLEIDGTVTEISAGIGEILPALTVPIKENATFCGYFQNGAPLDVEAPIRSTAPISAEFVSDFEVSEGLCFAPTDGGLGVAGFLKTASKTDRLIVPAKAKNPETGEIESVVRILDDAFAYRKFSAAVLPQTLTEIGRRAFYGAELPHLFLPSSLLKIGAEAFKGVKGFRFFDAPENLREIASDAFIGLEIETFRSLGKYYFAEDGVLFCGKTLVCYPAGAAPRAYAAPARIETIGEYAFYGQTFSRLSFGKNVKTVGAHALEGARITTVKFGSAESFGEASLRGLATVVLEFPKSARAFLVNSLASVTARRVIFRGGSAAFFDSSMPSAPIYAENAVKNEILKKFPDAAVTELSALQRLAPVVIAGKVADCPEGVEEAEIDETVYEILPFALNVKSMKRIVFCGKPPKIGADAFYRSEGLELIVEKRYLDEFCAACPAYSKFFKATVEEPERFTVSFTVDGKTESAEAEEGEILTLFEPALAGHRFLHWKSGDETFAAGARYEVRGDAELIAVFEKLSYVVEFYADGKLLKTETVKYGEAATAPEVPTKEVTTEFEYRFMGWDKPFDRITEDLKIEAVFESFPRYYAVEFYADGKLLKSETVKYGEAAIPPEVPTKEATAEYEYRFVGWDKPLDRVTEDLKIEAVFESVPRYYAVEFYADGKLLKTESVKYGEAAIPPEVPTKEATAAYEYCFMGWDKPFDRVTEALKIEAVFSETLRHYAVIVRFDGAILFETSVEYGKTLGKLPETLNGKTVSEYLYASGGSAKESDLVFGETELTPVFEAEYDPYFATEGLEFVFDYEVNAYVLAFYTGDSEDVVVPARFHGEDGDAEVVRIDRSVFEYRRLARVTLPETIAEIGDFAFYAVEGLSEIVLPKSVVSIGNYAFSTESGSLNIIVTGENLTEIGWAQEPALRLFIADALLPLYRERFADRSEIEILPISTREAAEKVGNRLHSVRGKV